MTGRLREHLRTVRLGEAERALRDAAWTYDRFGGIGPPSRQEERLGDVLRLIAKVENLGGDPLSALPYGLEYLARDALPDVYERVKGGTERGNWTTRRRASA